MKNIKLLYFILAFTIAVLVTEIIVVIKLNLIPLDAIKSTKLQIPKTFIVQSGSMEPTIKTGSLVFVSSAGSYVPNDIITFKSSTDSKVLVTHRLIEHKGSEYFTAGDANKTPDNGSVTKDQIMGKVVLSIPYLGYGADFAKKPFGFILLVIVPATIIIYEELKFLASQISKIRFAKSFASVSVIKNFTPKKFILIPIGASLIVFISITTAYFFDIEDSPGNTLGAAESFGEKTAMLYDSNEFSCSEGATNLNTPQAKLSIFEKSAGNVNVTVVLEGATPNSIYDLWLNQDPGGCPQGVPTEVGAIQTDASGNGTGDVVSPEIDGATKFWISAVGGGQVLRSAAVEF